MAMAIGSWVGCSETILPAVRHQPTPSTLCTPLSFIGFQRSWRSVGVGVTYLKLCRMRNFHVQRRSGACYMCAGFKAVEKLGDAQAVDILSNFETLPAAAGVYAVYDKVGALQYLGLSRKISASIQAHAQDLPELCGSVKVSLVDAPDRAALTEAWKGWMEEHITSTGEIPPGNVQGVTTWTARKPKATKQEIRLTPGPHVKLTVPLEELIGKIVREVHVVAFIKGTRTAPQCGFSHRVLTILNDLKVDYETVNVLDDHYNPGLREAIKNYSQWPTIPQVYVKGEFVGGADILDELVRSQEIKALFSKIT